MTQLCHIFSHMQVFTVSWSPHAATQLMTGAADRRLCMWDLSRIGQSSSNSSSSLPSSRSTSPTQQQSNAPSELVFVHGGHSEKIHDFSWHPHAREHNLIASVADNGMVQVRFQSILSDSPAWLFRVCICEDSSMSPHFSC